MSSSTTRTGSAIEVRLPLAGQPIGPLGGGQLRPTRSCHSQTVCGPYVSVSP